MIPQRLFIKVKACCFHVYKPQLEEVCNPSPVSRLRDFKAEENGREPAGTNKTQLGKLTHNTLYSICYSQTKTSNVSIGVISQYQISAYSNLVMHSC